MKTWVLISGLVFLSLAFGIDAYTYFQQEWLMQVAGNIPAVEALAYIYSGFWIVQIISSSSAVLVVLGLLIHKNEDLEKWDINCDELSNKNEKKKKK